MALINSKGLVGPFTRQKNKRRYGPRKLDLSCIVAGWTKCGKGGYHQNISGPSSYWSITHLPLRQKAVGSLLKGIVITSTNPGTNGTREIRQIILAHNKRERGWNCQLIQRTKYWKNLVSWINESDQEDSWEPLQKFTDENGVVTEALIQYIINYPELSNYPYIKMRLQ